MEKTRLLPYCPTAENTNIAWSNSFQLVVAVLFSCCQRHAFDWCRVAFQSGLSANSSISCSTLVKTTFSPPAEGLQFIAVVFIAFVFLVLLSFSKWLILTTLCDWTKFITYLYVFLMVLVGLDGYGQWVTVVTSTLTMIYGSVNIPSSIMIFLMIVAKKRSHTLALIPTQYGEIPIFFKYVVRSNKYVTPQLCSPYFIQVKLILSHLKTKWKLCFSQFYFFSLFPLIQCCLTNRNEILSPYHSDVLDISLL